MAELLEQVRQLDRRGLIALMREVTARLGELEESDWELSPEQKAQIDTECDAYERDGDIGEPWETVRARIVAQLGARTESEKMTV